MICQDGVDSTRSRFLLACCSQHLHEACACGLLFMQRDEEATQCPCCRRAFSKDMEAAATAICHRLWGRSARQARRFVLLADEEQAYHAECCDEMRLVTEAEGLCDNVTAPLSRWSPDGDQIHDFVARNCSGHWPVASRTWLRLSTADWRGVTMRFEGLRNVFWDEPTIRLSHGDVAEELETIELPLSSLRHAALRTPPKPQLDV